MRWTPLKKFFAGTAAVLGVGLGYLAFRKPKSKSTPEIDATPSGPGPQTVPTTPAAPQTPEGVSPFPGAAPPNWQKTFNDGVMVAIDSARQNEQVSTSEDVQFFVGSRLFPGATWPPADNAQDWQKKVWQETRATLFRLSGAESWPFPGTAETVDAAITMWLAAHRNVQHCLQLGLGDALSVRTCAANRTFPGLEWPPPASAAAWQRAAWDLFVIAP